jgi:hypothetical protein
MRKVDIVITSREVCGEASLMIDFVRLRRDGEAV